MKRNAAILFLSMMCIAMHAQWKPAGEKIKTNWGESINPQQVHQEYPRPMLERKDWKNLNGMWQYAIRDRGQAVPSSFDGEILVPFAVESALSGVGKRVGDNQELWYSTAFEVPANWRNKSVNLNFGAVDWLADVYINDVLIGSHQGGFTPFSFDITPYLTSGKKQQLMVRVWDPTDRGFQPRGKQVNNPEGIWYTPVTGIWQTVWIEPVAQNHITAVKAIPNIDNSTLAVTVNTSEQSPDGILQVDLFDGEKKVASAKGVAGKELRLAVPNAKLWDTESPFLYDMKVTLSENGKVQDEVDSYTAMRKVSTRRDDKGILRMQLNNKDLFQFGPLDQGWWPDGLYTAPSDEALYYDIKKTKDLGYNMIRKHVKVEPARWYYHCDKEGMLVWQDMPSGDHGNHWDPHKYNGGTDKVRTAESEENFYQEWTEIMNLLISNPSVVVWVPFNEAWGQFKTEDVAQFTKNYDPSRLVNPASGGNHRACGDMIDLHNYPGPRMFLFDAERVNVLGEYGGIGLALDNHLWLNDRNWGYIQFKSPQEVTNQYIQYTDELKNLIDKGFAAAVYTQTTDVEGEVNGLMTYDRKVVKVDEQAVRKANQSVINHNK
ncbi:MAG: glycoside hydrolase family 2 protein [Tannerellaceae bacterium]